MPITYPGATPDWGKKEKEAAVPWWLKKMRGTAEKEGTGTRKIIGDVKKGVAEWAYDPSAWAKRRKERATTVPTKTIRQRGRVWQPGWNALMKPRAAQEAFRAVGSTGGYLRDPYADPYAVQGGVPPQQQSRSWYPDTRYPTVPSGVARDPYTRTNIRPKAWDAMQYTPESLRLAQEYWAWERAQGQEQYQQGYYGSGGYGYGGYGGYGGGGGGYGGGSFPEQETKGYAPRDEYQVPWYQAMLQWNI